MDPISESQFQKNVARIYHFVFANENPFNARFRPNIQRRLLLFPFTYGLSDDESDVEPDIESDTEPWLFPLTKAINALEENGFYLSVLGRTGPEPWHWYVPLNEAHVYIDKVFPLENAIYSVNGQWGVICSHENHAVMGGPEMMIKVVQESVHNWDDRLRLFLTMWKRYHEQNKADIGWLPNLISHIYGNNIPEAVIQDPELKILLKMN